MKPIVIAAIYGIEKYIGQFAKSLFLVNSYKKAVIC